MHISFYLHVHLCLIRKPAAWRSRKKVYVPWNWSYKWLQAALLVPGIKPQSSRKRRSQISGLQSHISSLQLLSV